jgi:hypothetical protein
MAPPLPASLATSLMSASATSNGSHATDSLHHSFNKISKRKVQNLFPVSQSGAVRKTAAGNQQKKDIFRRNNSKRGRPPRFNKPRDSFDSCNSSDASSSGWGSLDLFIPPPSDFDGFNNPFRDVDNCLRVVGKIEKNVIKDRNQKPRLFEINLEPVAGSIFGGPKESKPSTELTTCARRLTVDGELQFLVERDLPPGPILD